MAELKLVEPSIAYKDAYIDMIEEWRATGEKLTSFVLRFEHRNFDVLPKELAKLRDNPKLDEKTVNRSTFWFVKERGSVVGAVHIRHRLNPYLAEVGGHIGFGIRPGERRKRYATEREVFMGSLAATWQLAPESDPGVHRRDGDCQRQLVYG